MARLRSTFDRLNSSDDHAGPTFARVSDLDGGALDRHGGPALVADTTSLRLGRAGLRGGLVALSVTEVNRLTFMRLTCQLPN